MSQSRPAMSSTGRINVTIMSLSDVEKIAKEMNDALTKLISEVIKAQSEYSIYIEQKSFVKDNHPDQMEAGYSLFKQDFMDFKNQLNQAIRAYNDFQHKFKIPLAILNSTDKSKDSPKDKNEPLRLFNFATTTLDGLRSRYYQDKPLYEEIAPQASPAAASAPAPEPEPSVSPRFTM